MPHIVSPNKAHFSTAGWSGQRGHMLKSHKAKDLQEFCTHILLNALHGILPSISHKTGCYQS